MKNQLTLLFLFSFLISFSQERISDIETNILPDDVYLVNDYYSFVLDDTNYMLYRDQSILQLVNMDDLQVPVRSFDLQVDCPVILGLDELDDTNRNFYVYDRRYGRVFNIDSTENQNRFIFFLPTGGKTGVIGDKYMYRYKRTQDIMGVEIIDLKNFSRQYYEYEGIISIKIIDDHIITISDDWNEWSELDVNTGALRLIHSGPGTIHSQNLSNVNNEFLCIDSYETVLLYDLESETVDSLCLEDYTLFYGKFFNSKNCYYYQNSYLVIDSDITYVRNKMNCNEVEILNIGRNYYTPITYSNDSVDIVFLYSQEKAIIYNETTSETINIEVQFNSAPEFVTIDQMIYLLSRENAENNEFRLDKIDMITGAYSSIHYVIPGMYSIDKLSEGENNKLIVLAKIGHVISKVEISTQQEEYSIETATSSRDYGLIRTSEWNKKGSTISSQVINNTTLLASVKEGSFQDASIDSLKSGYFQWDNLIAGMVTKDESLYFQLIDHSTLAVQDELFVSSLASEEFHEIVRIGDQYYELVEGKLYARYPEVSSLPSFENLFVNEVILQSESEVIVIGQREGFALSMLKIDESGISTVISDVGNSFYQSHSIWTTSGQRKVFHFENDTKDQSYIVCVDTQTGLVSEVKSFNGSVFKTHAEQVNKGWITFTFENMDDEFTFIVTNGKKIKTFSTEQISIDVASFPKVHYENGRLFYIDNTLGMVSLKENGDYTIVPIDNIEEYFWFHDILFIDDNYYLFFGTGQGIMASVLNEGLTNSELLFESPYSICGYIFDVSILGVTPEDLIVFSMNNLDTGNELWSLNVSTHEFELFADLNGYYSSGFKSIEFYEDNHVYFKAADSTGIFQLYRLGLDEQVVSTSEVINKLNTIHVYPNPASEEIRINQALNEVRILDIRGVVQGSIDYNPTSKTISLRDLALGIYFVEGYTESGVKYTGKFVKL
ncbi:MAG: T9SS type A sorting domain-containing protein [Saprospiraceae bacterium]|nr:T9SS type A sorting domain-containing protein [Saprospiraceae bacterium]